LVSGVFTAPVLDAHNKRLQSGSQRHGLPASAAVSAS
jgi:hypothetical protein